LFRCRPRTFLTVLITSVTILARPLHAHGDERVLGPVFQDRVNGALAILGLTAVPDIAASSLTISDETSDDTRLLLWQFGDGFTLSDDLPLFLEGYLGYARYDPVFVLSDGEAARPFGVRWNSLSATIGLGASIPVAPSLDLRPTANLSFGHIESDLSLAGRLIETETGIDLPFLDGGRMNAVGYGGSLVLDYQRWTAAYELDAELRYTHLRLEPFDTTSPATEFGSDAIAASLWARYRWPTGWSLFGLPMRYVVDLAHTTYLGDSDDALGFNHLTRVGAGLEMEIGGVALLSDRLRVMGRFLFGEDVRGYSVSLAVSF